jgi:hypothetical protein
MRKYISRIVLSVCFICCLTACKERGNLSDAGTTRTTLSKTDLQVTGNKPQITEAPNITEAQQITDIPEILEATGVTEALKNTEDGNVTVNKGVTGTSESRDGMSDDTTRKIPGPESVSSSLNRAIVKDGDLLYSRADNCIKCFDLKNGTESLVYEASKKNTIIDYFIYDTVIYLLNMMTVIILTR